MNKSVIYTCLTGNYDGLKQPKYIYDGYDYICFSNEFSESHIGIWEIRKIPFETNDKLRLSRFVKINPHLALPEYEYSLWMDSNLQIVGDELKDKLDELIQKDTFMAFVPHPIYNCIYADAFKCIWDGRDSYLMIKKQVKYLKSQGYPFGNGLYENNLIFRKHNHCSSVTVSEAWWKMYMTYSKRDQLSLCYVLWANHINSVELLLPHGVSTHNYEAIKRVKHNPNSLWKRIQGAVKRTYYRFLLCLFGL